MYLHTRQHRGHKSIVGGEDDREQQKSKQLFRKQVSQYVRLPGNTESTRPPNRTVDISQSCVPRKTGGRSGAAKVQATTQEASKSLE